MWGDVKNWERIEHSRAICAMSWQCHAHHVKLPCEVFPGSPRWTWRRRLDSAAAIFPTRPPNLGGSRGPSSGAVVYLNKRETNKSKAYHLGFKSITDLIQELAGHVFYDFMSMELTWTYSGCLLWACTDSNRMCSQSLLFVIPSQHGFSFDSGRGQQIGLTAGVSLENIREMYSDATKMPQRRNDAFMEAGISLELAQFVCDSGS